MPRRTGWRSSLSPTALVTAAAVLCAPLVACTSSDGPVPPAVDDSARGARPPLGQPAGRAPDTTRRAGMSTGKKMVMLGGAAALYYLYKHHQNAAVSSQGAEGQYYLSKNGRVYYRDAQHRAHWVTPPSEGIAVPEQQAAEYSQFQGYEGRTDGRDLTGLGND